MSWRDHLGTLLLLILFAGSLTLNVHLGRRVLAGPSAAAPPPSPSLGKLLSPMRAKSLDGQTVNLDFTDGTPTVLYYLSPACVWCNRNYPNIRTLASQRSGSYPFVGVARGSDSTTLRDYLEQRPLSFEVYLVPDREWLSSHGLAGTPAMILIDGGGRVTRVWNGALMLERLAEVEEVFGVKLPGVESVSQ